MDTPSPRPAAPRSVDLAETLADLTEAQLLRLVMALDQGVEDEICNTLRAHYGWITGRRAINHPGAPAAALRLTRGGA